MKILWAFDPSHHETKLTKKMHSLLKALAKNPGAIEFASVITRTEPWANLAFDIPLEKRFTSYPRELIRKSLTKAGITAKPNKVHVLQKESIAITPVVDTLLHFAKSKRFDLVALYTQGRTGFVRQAMGSFAETAIHRSSRSLLLVSPRSSFAGKIKNVFFSTDFESNFSRDLSRAIQICKKTKAKLTVFHAAELIYSWSLQESSSHVQAYRKRIHQMQEKTLAECRKHKVDCEVVIKSDFETIGHSVLKQANKTKADLLLVTAKAGSFTALMGGSVTRYLVRNASVPVLVFR